MKKHERIVFRKGDLVEINFKFVVLPEHDNLYIVLDCQEASGVYGNDYVHLSVREVNTGRELTAYVDISNGREYCEFLHVE